MRTFSSALPSDDIMIRCPRLGHQVPFNYCRAENAGAPCFKTLDCWHGHFDVVAYFTQTLSKDEYAAAFMHQARPKIQTLMDLIEQARTRVSENNAGSDNGRA